METIKMNDLRNEKLTLFIGLITGQMAELLNSMNQEKLTVRDVYKRLFDIHSSASLQIHELYYKGNTL